ncbi:hypothetical protein QA597_09565 [Marinilabiliaceae bacterium ANBcel2]|nr:hypothetical protein [Marinilabiliaceae bacterium ANBcel2]
MSSESVPKYSIQLSFEDIRLPPVKDILVLGKKCPQGRIGVFRSFQFLVPNEFDSFEIDNEEAVEAVFINKRVLKKISPEKIIAILKENVFPYVSENEVLKVDFKLRVYYESIEGEL